MRKLVSAAQSNLILGPIATGISMLAMAITARLLSPVGYADVAVLLAIVSWMLFLVEGGSGVGMVRFLSEARRKKSGGTFYLRLALIRLLTGILVALLFVMVGEASGPVFGLAGNGWTQITYGVVGLTVAANLQGYLGNYALLGSFHHQEVLIIQSGVAVMRAAALVASVAFGSGVLSIAAALMGVAAVEAAIFVYKAWSELKGERQPLERGMIRSALRHGWVTVFDKLTSGITGGGFLIIILGGVQPRASIAFLAIASDLIVRILAAAGSPIQRFILPFLSEAVQDERMFRRAMNRVVQFSCLLLVPVCSLAICLWSPVITLLLGPDYQTAVVLAMIMTIPAFLDSWVRGTVVIGLLTKQLYRLVMVINIAQGIVVLITLAFVFRQDIKTVVWIMSLVRLVLALLVAWVGYFRGLLRMDMVPWRFALIAAGAGLPSGLYTLLTMESPVVALLGTFALYVAILVGGVRISRTLDVESTHVLREILGPAAKVIDLVAPGVGVGSVKLQ